MISVGQITLEVSVDSGDDGYDVHVKTNFPDDLVIMVLEDTLALLKSGDDM